MNFIKWQAILITIYVFVKFPASSVSFITVEQIEDVSQSMAIYLSIFLSQNSSQLTQENVFKDCSVGNICGKKKKWISGIFHKWTCPMWKNPLFDGRGGDC